DRFTHGIDAEYGVLSHRGAAFEVALTGDVQQADLAVPGHQRDAARQLPGVDILPPQMLANAAQLAAVEAQRFGDYQFHADSFFRGGIASPAVCQTGQKGYS